MKYLVIAIFFLNSCSTKENELLKNGESFLKQNLNDPASYEKITAEIKDTITSYEFLKDAIKYNTTRYEDEVKRESPSTMLTDFYSQKIDSLQKAMQVADSNEVYYIELNYRYRAKNKFGALVVQNSQIRYFAKEAKFFPYDL